MVLVTVSVVELAPFVPGDCDVLATPPTPAVVVVVTPPVNKNPGLAF